MIRNYCTIVTLLLIASNFLYQAFNGGDIMIACERSYFQIVAILSVYINIKFDPLKLKHKDSKP